jgi:hypothetical protein
MDKGRINKMNSEEKEERKLFALPAVQKLFREKMGEWQLDDRGLLPKPYITVRVIKTNNELLFSFIDGGTLSIHDSSVSQFLRIPQTIDQDNPERGLWGMLDWLDWLIDVDGDNHITLSKIGTNFTVEGVPTLAILKALVEQIGEN